MQKTHHQSEFPGPNSCGGSLEVKDPVIVISQIKTVSRATVNSLTTHFIDCQNFEKESSGANRHTTAITFARWLVMGDDRSRTSP